MLFWVNICRSYVPFETIFRKIHFQEISAFLVNHVTDQTTTYHKNWYTPLLHGVTV